ncbi:MAG: phenylacetate-CoA oxygenase/reductase subunit PaaK [Actinobacteria bacterium]|nr:phenylacetate-CoA oxygenase/reductase subunit PaaK [Actinomycetota bacterium]
MDFHELAVAAVEELTPESVAISFEIPAELRDEFEFVPGQHLILEREGARRTYSICSEAGSGEVRIAVKLLPGGAFSTWANESLAAGDRLAVAAPTGGFAVATDPANRKRYAAIAAGSGITPIVSMASSVLAAEPRSRFVLVYGNRTSATTMFLEELQDLKNLHPERFELINVFSREPQAVELFSGRLDHERLGRVIDGLVGVEDVDEWLLCGPLGLIETAGEVLDERGVDLSNVHREVFHADAAAVSSAPVGADDENAASVQIRLDGRESTLPVLRDGAPILDAVLRARADAPYACRGGVCGTCRARVLEGEVRMDIQYALEPAEVEAGYVLACQAHPLSARVVLDFDQ